MSAGVKEVAVGIAVAVLLIGGLIFVAQPPLSDAEMAWCFQRLTPELQAVGDSIGAPFTVDEVPVDKSPGPNWVRACKADFAASH